MRLYRVETQSGVGPYRREDLSDTRCGVDVPCVADGVPTPYQEGINRMPWGTRTYYGFAFNDQLNRWFAGKWFKRLARLNYGVAEYTISERSVLVTPAQALYNSKAKSLRRVQWTPLTEIVTKPVASPAQVTR